jgi:hypothetical protein
MSDKASSTEAVRPPETARDRRLAAALRANLMKRKAQQRARLASHGAAGPAEPDEEAAR